VIIDSSALIAVLRAEGDAAIYAAELKPLGNRASPP
jgi:uncharacterized protein with PIN domain